MKPLKNIPKDVQSAYKEAVNSRNKAYAPYSNFLVGSCVITKSKKIYSGCNIENSAYGDTVCAERVALWKCISTRKEEITDLVLVTDLKTPATPCGSCLQVMAEFITPNTNLWLCNLKGIQSKFTFKDFLPMAFLPEVLLESNQ